MAQNVTKKSYALNTPTQSTPTPLYCSSLLPFESGVEALNCLDAASCMYDVAVETFRRAVDASCFYIA